MPQVTITDYQTFEAMARYGGSFAKAIADAKMKAKKLARELRVHLDDIVSYSESGGFPTPIYYGTAMGGKGGDMESLPPATPTGENEITVSVYLGYGIDD